MEVCDGSLEALLVLDLRNAFKLWIKRPGALGLYRSFVHAGSVIVANLLFATAFWRFSVPGSSLQNFVKDISVPFIEDICDTPIRVGWRDWICGKPSAVCVLIKVGTRRCALVEICRIKAVPLLLSEDRCHTER